MGIGTDKKCNYILLSAHRTVHKIYYFANSCLCNLVNIRRKERFIKLSRRYVFGGSRKFCT